MFSSFSIVRISSSSAKIISKGKTIPSTNNSSDSDSKISTSASKFSTTIVVPLLYPRVIGYTKSKHNSLSSVVLAAAPGAFMFLITFKKVLKLLLFLAVTVSTCCICVSLSSSLQDVKINTVNNKIVRLDFKYFILLKILVIINKTTVYRTTLP